MSKYSDAEVKLFTRLGFLYHLEYFAPFDMYSYVAKHLFTSNQTEGEHIDAFRKACKVLFCPGLNKPLRLTPEFDDLIKFSEEDNELSQKKWFDKIYEEIELIRKQDYTLERLLDQIQASIVLAGGCKMSHERINEMKIRDFLEIAFKNGIEITVRPKDNCVLSTQVLFRKV